MLKPVFRCQSLESYASSTGGASLVLLLFRERGYKEAKVNPCKVRVPDNKKDNEITESLRENENKKAI